METSKEEAKSMSCSGYYPENGLVMDTPDPTFTERQAVFMDDTGAKYITNERMFVGNLYTVSFLKLFPFPKML